LHGLIEGKEDHNNLHNHGGGKFRPPFSQSNKGCITMRTISTLCPETGTRIQNRGKIYELAFWATLLAAINFPLLTGNIPELFILDVQLVKSGQFWRMVTHPFAHVSIYHLFMDALAFLMIYAGLEEKSAFKRLSYTAGCGIGSLLLSLLFSHPIYNVGLAGLSGIAHGLMAVSSLELMKNHEKGTTLFRAGIVIFAMVTIKSIAEMWSGDVVFSSLHLGSVGIPIVASHLGGVIGGIVSFIILNKRIPFFIKQVARFSFNAK
jgi:rhomboid family GlyGly-CTERM serine protease